MAGSAGPDLREFVYLDEVSLRSLLSSQKGGVTDSTSEQATDARDVSLAGTLSASSPLVGKAAIESRYGTTNSSTIQTSRKATVQSWFRELHEIPGLRLIESVIPSKAAKDINELLGVDDQSLLASAGALRRGKLVEFRVRLSADPVFHLGTMVSEFTGMAEDYPEMFAAGNGLASLNAVQPINKILQRLLAGLIPIRATAVDHVVVQIGGLEYIAHTALIDGLGLPVKRLEIVGVTEHLAYWKDIRRVLFSEAEFTMLCRIARPALHDSWTPVKLADLFRPVTPDLVDQINAASSAPFGAIGTTPAETSNEARLGRALQAYADATLAHFNKNLSDEQVLTIGGLIEELKSGASTVSGQRAAFSALTGALSQMTDATPDPQMALELRDAARHNSGLSMFPSQTASAVVSSSTPPSTSVADAPRLLDVDVIAIYW